MDIIKYAKEIHWAADYMDMTSMNIFKISEANFYNYEKIPVIDVVGNLLGYIDVPEKDRPAA